MPNKHPLKSTTCKEVDYTFGAWLCSNGEVASFFDDETLSHTKSESPRPNRHPRYDPDQILFFQEDGWDLQEKALKETRGELEEGREEEHVQFLHKTRLGVNP